MKDGDNENVARYMLKPTVVARLIELAELKSDDLVLVVGSSVGYSATVIAQIVESVVGVEEDESLFQDSINVTSELGTDNLAILLSKMSEGLEEEGPFDVIFINGAVEKSTRIVV